MPTNFNLLKNNLLNYFESNKNKKSKGDLTSDVARKISDEYEIAVTQGGDALYNNPVITYNKAALRFNIENAFRAGFGAPNQSVVSSVFGSSFSAGLIGFWTGATLALAVPPPGSISVVTNLVLFPGSPIPVLRVSNTTNKAEFVDNLIGFFQQHLRTLSGITTGLVPATVAPVPTPYPWVGYN